MRHIRNEKAEENMELLDLPCQDGVFIDDTIDNGVCCLVYPADLHDVDALSGCRADGNKLTTYIPTGSEEFVALQRSNDKYLCSLSSHSQGHELHGEGLARTAGAENGHVRILIDTAVEDIHDDQAIVMLIHTQKDAIFIGHFITGEWITAGHGGCEHISLAAFEESLFQSAQRHDRVHGHLLPEVANGNVHIL